MDSNDLVEKSERAYYIMLSLCRELYIRIRQQHENAEKYAAQVVKIKHEMRYFDKEQLINKAETVYAPLLKEMIGEK